ncbi:hypothetical protein MEW_03964 [Candida albicans P60002]|nr:hypothetical protein MEQ_04011 [Candida albicans P87]KGU23837.1 hypothetical protein MG7_04030 [Candida albicans P34048]KGU26286.1 hypothetical protein MGM_04058 [Candida albicans P75063]KHC33315.1 hypothetical protein MGO_04016 [Candida albicans P76055]KHC33917.1 hypothetical protein MGQ_04019 [Candida albicans P76067]KHC36124.1 hypothetical protein W5O_04074 [Candida albicans Ca6]KHC49345.1 hypothetical protein MEW_03964 [Candida albicans P60002]KHC73965.1 hypothetical protein MGS_04060
MASRDLPHSLNDLAFGWVKHLKEEIIINKNSQQLVDEDFQPDEDVTKETKVKLNNLWPAFASGAGLFADGYVNNSIGIVMACLKILYGDEFTKSNAISNIGSIGFVGTVVGQLSFGYISDRVARKGGMMTANIMLIAFTLLCAVGSWGTTIQGFFACLTVWRFCLGVAIGAEYPTSSVIASEFANQLPAGKRNRYFIWFTGFMIDFGFVVSAFVPFVLLWIFTEKHLRALWRVSIGLGAILPTALFFIRLKMKDSTSFEKLHMKNVRYRDYPWWLIVKFYWFRLTIVSMIWFIYNFSVYSFGTFNAIILGQIIPDAPLWQQWGWSVVFNLFYIPGSFLGAFSADYLGPRLTLAIGVGLQGIIGFIMSACLNGLRKQVAAFTVVFGIFATLGEFGPGGNIGLLASKTSATPIRGQYYGIAAAMGKIGAFVGTWIFPAIQRRYASKTNPDLELQVPFYLSSGLCIFSALLTFFLCPHVGQDAINREDKEFVEYLRKNGFDVSKLGEDSSSVDVDVVKDTDSAEKISETIEVGQKLA